MRFLLVNNDYPAFLASHYAREPRLREAFHDEILKARAASLFANADFFSSNLRALGHEAWDVAVNDDVAQRAWAREHGVALPARDPWTLVWRRGIVPWLRRSSRTVLEKIVLEQVVAHRPDVVVNFSIGTLSEDALRAIRERVRWLVGWGEPSSLMAPHPWKLYDVVLAPSETMVDHYRSQGLRTELLRFGFEPRVLELLGEERGAPIATSFVGSFSKVHRNRTELVEHVARSLELSAWSPDVDALDEASPLRRSWKGPAWGREAYSILRRSRATLNVHAAIGGEDADNMRLYEATGVGTLLVTDAKRNLGKILEPGKECVAYSSPEECVELVKHYLAHEDERAAIARAGQKRTLAEHTYRKRMAELAAIMERLASRAP